MPPDRRALPAAGRPLPDPAKAASIAELRATLAAWDPRWGKKRAHEAEIKRRLAAGQSE